MSTQLRGRTLAGLVVLVGLALIAPTASMAAAAPLAAAHMAAAQTTAAQTAAKPKAAPLPKAQSWVGGKNLIGSGELTDLAAGVPAPPKLKATSWLVADLDTRQILAGQRVHVPLAPASTLKIFTALALAHRLNPKSVYTGRNDDAAVDGTKVGIVPGSTYTVNDLLHGMLMSSGNDCANALGNANGGKTKAIGLIQSEATALGAFDTVVHTTNGLDAPGQVSSAYDLALAGSAAVKVPQLEKVMTTKDYHFPGVGKSLGQKRKRFDIQSHDQLLYNYPGAIGVKNGFTIHARGSFVGAATRNGHTYLAVVMRAEGSTSHESAQLLDWAFAHAAKAKAVGTLVTPGELPAMIGPGNSGGASASAAQGSPAPTAAADRGPLHAALPAVQTSLSKPSSSGRTGEIWLGAAALALVMIAFVAGRRPRGTRSRAKRSGRHRD